MAAVPFTLTGQYKVHHHPPYHIVEFCNQAVACVLEQRDVVRQGLHALEVTFPNGENRILEATDDDIPLADLMRQATNLVTNWYMTRAIHG